MRKSIWREKNGKKGDITTLHNPVVKSDIHTRARACIVREITWASLSKHFDKAEPTEDHHDQYISFSDEEKLLRFCYEVDLDNDT